MRRVKKHRIKEENLAASSSSNRVSEEHDLAYFIHDRVELMHQVFSVLKSKELKSFAPECVRRLSTDDLQELCLEELLGISSKRLCAILDGAEPPSDTESSSQSPEHLETISLDSISSDEEILSQGSKKKKKHRHAKKKRRKKSKASDSEDKDKDKDGGGGGGETRAARAGLTVLELLELQARARAIRAQLHQEPARLQSEPTVEAASSDNEVEIKEEPAEVVEISSDEEKPDRLKLDQQIGTSTINSNETAVNKITEPQTVTKKINNLVITVPQSKPTRKIRLKRQKPTESVTKENDTTNNVEDKEAKTGVAQNASSNAENSSNTSVAKENNVAADTAEAKSKAKKNKKKKKKAKDKEGSDQDEITLQLSDSEKMDLLEDLDAKNLDNVTSSGSDSSDNDQQDHSRKPDEKNEVDTSESKNDNTAETVIELVSENKNETESEETNKEAEIRGFISNDNDGTVEMDDLPVIVDKGTELSETEKDKNEETPKVDDKPDIAVAKCDETVEVSQEITKEATVDEKEKSDGEISDRESSEVEASDVQPEIVCISDEEGKKKKKKKKDKKSKKEKKKSGFHESDDENFYKDKANTGSNIIQMTIDDDDDIYEILEISDDSSCYEVEGVSVLSKEPTAEEIEAFSAKMDEIEIDREQTVVTNEKESTAINETYDAENVSWKDRYLGSTKVRRVLTTSNILNAIRKKNIELKKKLEEAKNAEKIEKDKQNEEESKPEEQVATVEDGSIEQYETLQGSTKYVDPVKGVEVNDKEKGDTEKGDDTEKEGTTESAENLVTREMKKDARMLLKMYKRLLKYNDVNKQKDPNKKKKKKQKKSKDKEKVKDSI